MTLDDGSFIELGTVVNGGLRTKHLKKQDFLGGVSPGYDDIGTDVLSKLEHLLNLVIIT